MLIDTIFRKSWDMSGLKVLVVVVVVLYMEDFIYQEESPWPTKTLDWVVNFLYPRVRLDHATPKCGQ